MVNWMRQMRKYMRQPRLAHADQFIKMLPNGYDTMLSGDGEELSQGQRPASLYRQSSRSQPAGTDPG